MMEHAAIPFNRKEKNPLLLKIEELVDKYFKDLNLDSETAKLSKSEVQTLLFTIMQKHQNLNAYDPKGFDQMYDLHRNQEEEGWGRHEMI